MKKRTRPVTKKQILRGPKKAQYPNLRLLFYPNKNIILRDGKLFEQVENDPVFFEIGEVVCRIP